MLSCHEPATPTLLEGQTMINGRLADASHEHARDADRIVRVVAGDALVTANNARCADQQQRTIERVERHALRGILRCQLDEAATNPADHDRVIEEQRAGIASLDPPRLHAVFGKHGDLRLDGNAQGSQERA